MAYLIFLYVILVFIRSYSLGGACNYDMNDVPTEGLIINTAEIGNQSIQTLTFEMHDVPLAHKRDVGPLATLLNSSPYFEIVNNEVFITDCPPVRQTQRLDITLDENEDCEYSFHVIVNPSIAVISVPDNTIVMFGSSVDAIDILEFTIENEGRCTSFECSVNFINAAAKVWIDKDSVLGTNVIRSSRYDIQFGFVYQLRLSCDTPTLEDDIDEETPVLENEVTEEISQGIREEIIDPSVAVIHVTFIYGSSVTSGKHQSLFARTTIAMNSSASPALLDKTNLSVRLVMPMTVILRWGQFLN